MRAHGSLPGPVSEEYLQARALLSSFMVAHRVRVRSRSRPRALHQRHHEGCRVSRPAGPASASPNCSTSRHGFGGQIHVMHARRAFDEALKLDPASTEANLYRIYMLLSRGEKESARHGIANLLTSARQRLERAHGRRPRPPRRRHVRRSARPVQPRAQAQPGQRSHPLQPPRPRLPLPEPARTGRRRTRKGPRSRAAPPAAAHLVGLPADAHGQSGRGHRDLSKA